MVEDIEIKGGVAGIIEAARGGRAVEVFKVAEDAGELLGTSLASVHMVGVPEAGGGTKVISALDEVKKWRAEFATRPLRRKGTIVAHSVESFIDVVNRQKIDVSVIFADVQQKKMTAVIDFHEAHDGEPAFGEDRIVYGFTLSQQIATWFGASQRTMDQKTFSRLIDDNLGDIAEGGLAEGSIAFEFARRRGINFASVADLLVFTRTIATKSTTESEEVIDERTGDVSIQYKKRGDVKTNDGKPVAVPHAFALRIPVLNGIGATEFNIPVRLRYDITEKGIVWTIEIHALDRFVQAAIEEAVEKVRAPDGGCGLPVYLASAPGQ